MNCSQCQELLEGYALDALDADQSAQVRAHLQSGCAACSAELAEVEAVLAQLPLSLDPQVPSAQVRVRLLEKIRGAGSNRDEALSAVPVTRQRVRWAEPLIAAAAAAAITAGFFWVRLDRQQRELDALRDQMAAQQARVDELRTGLENQGNSIRMFASPAVQLVSLQGSSQQPAAKGRVFWDRERDTFHLYAANLKQPPAGKSYELWFITSNQKKVPAGTFSIGPQGEASFAAKPPADAAPVVALAVTEEPSGGSEQPTGQIQLLGQAH